MNNILKKIVILLITVYQKYISPFTPPSCRHTPTCSVYAKQVIQEYGVLKGGWKAVKRILTCNPWHS
jgi:hypothetical protein